MAARRSIFRVKVSYDGRPSTVVRFPADWWNIYEMKLAAAETQIQKLGDVNNFFVQQEYIVALKSDIEGVVWWKVASDTPTTATAAIAPTRELRPFEVINDREWFCTTYGPFIQPAIVAYNPTTTPANIQIFYATRLTDTQCGGI